MLNFEEIQLKRLGISTIRRRYQGNIYFKFEGNVTSSRTSRNSPAVDRVNESYDKSSPCDQVSWAKIYEYHEEMENGRSRQQSDSLLICVGNFIYLRIEERSYCQRLQSKESEVKNESDLDKKCFLQLLKRNNFNSI